MDRSIDSETDRDRIMITGKCSDSNSDNDPRAVYELLSVRCQLSSPRLTWN